MADRDIDLVLITGAGASCSFGNAATGPPQLPLMGGWSDALVQSLGQGGSYRLVELVGLERNLDGPTFEERLGNFLSLAEFFPAIGRVMPLSVDFPGQGNFSAQSLTEWHRTVLSQITRAVGIVYSSLIENFGWDRINADAAIPPYRTLLQAMGVDPNSRIVCATTNYDHILEWVLERLGRRPETGVRQPFTEPGVNTMAVLDMEEVVETVGRSVPVLHLHGAVGWFQQQGQRPALVRAKSYDDQWGVPIVMLPSHKEGLRQQQHDRDDMGRIPKGARASAEGVRIGPLYERRGTR